MKLGKYIILNEGREQRKVAEDAGMNEASLSRVLNGKECAYPRWRAGIAKALDWPQDRADELFEEVVVPYER